MSNADASILSEDDKKRLLAMLNGWDDIDDVIAVLKEKYSNCQKEVFAMSYNNAISASDPQAVEKLTDKLQKCRDSQEFMKGVNAHWRKTGACTYAPGITFDQAAKLDAKIADPKYPWDNTPFSDYELKNNYQEIRRLEKRIKEITRNKEVGFSGWEFDGGRADANTEINRLQLFFNERPSRERHNALRSHGFVYSHANSAYQRRLNSNAIYAAESLGFLKPINGMTVREHQPKASVRDVAAR